MHDYKMQQEILDSLKRNDDQPKLELPKALRGELKALYCPGLHTDWLLSETKEYTRTIYLDVKGAISITYMEAKWVASQKKGDDHSREQFVYLLCTHLTLHLVCIGPNYWDFTLEVGTRTRGHVDPGGEANSPGGMGPLRRRLAEEDVWATANLFFSPREYLEKCHQVSWECRNQGGHHCLSWLSPHERVSRVPCPPPADTFGRTRGKEGRGGRFLPTSSKLFLERISSQMSATAQPNWLMGFNGPRANTCASMLTTRLRFTPLITPRKKR